MRRAFAAFAAVGACGIGATAWAQQAGGLSNPLWSTSLDQLAATRDRPIFTQGRRPPPLAATPAAAQTAPVGDAGAPPFALVGTVVGDKEKFAVLLESGSQTVLRLPLGGSASGWNVAEVAPRSIRLTRGGQSVTLELPKPNLDKSGRDEGERAVLPRNGN